LPKQLRVPVDAVTAGIDSNAAKLALRICRSGKCTFAAGCVPVREGICMFALMIPKTGDPWCWKIPDTHRHGFVSVPVHERRRNLLAAYGTVSAYKRVTYKWVATWRRGDIKGEQPWESHAGAIVFDVFEEVDA
jgi:hypothetical protein